MAYRDERTISDYEGIFLALSRVEWAPLRFNPPDCGIFDMPVTDPVPGGVHKEINSDLAKNSQAGYFHRRATLSDIQGGAR